MEALRQLITAHEDWLMHRILGYAKSRDYVKYTSTLAEAWRISIANLSHTILTALDNFPAGLELGPDDDYSLDPIASFGIQEARKHRARGLTLGMFLSLLKYYRQCYLDLIEQAGFAPEQAARYSYFVRRCFDRVELGLCTEWTISTDSERLAELQRSNRELANEKNKYLTIFESLHDPVILLDQDNRVTNMNHAAARLLTGAVVPGDIYYDQQPTLHSLPWLAQEIAALSGSQAATLNFEKTFNTPKGVRHFDIKLERMLDISEKYSGTVVLLNDLTESKRAAIMEERERLARELHDSVTQSLYSLSLFAEWGHGLLEMGEADSALERLTRIGEISQQALREMRLLLYELRPSALEQDGLLGALKSRLAAVEQRVGVEVHFQANLTADLPAHVEECLYRIAQEALNNALKHAEAKSVIIRLKADGRLILLEVSDDGLGFDPGQINGSGRLGLAGMRARAERLGGTLELRTQPGAGTTLRLKIDAEAESSPLHWDFTEQLVEVTA
ncbi:MAG: PAS domain-containing protein [Anaerolineae bacterium]|nr:PAS domain-containing protein [Anaerolineae bacterium]